MKKGDLVWGLILVGVVLFVTLPQTKDVFIAFTVKFRYLSSFAKFAVLATMGELLAIRLKNGNWEKPKGFISRVIAWGLMGIIVCLVTKIFADGVMSAQKAGYLPFYGSRIISGFLTSFLNNIFFAPVLMALHRIAHSYIVMKYEEQRKVISFKQVIYHVDWKEFVDFVLLKTIPFFWIPAHTITFSLAENYRVIMAAMLSVVLGILLSIANKEKKQELRECA
ncbi:MAG: hypothetical protein GX285_09190 [Clostridiales bacterium]|nr:hypothetical protein [Clostridiales bacterium]